MIASIILFSTGIICIIMLFKNIRRLPNSKEVNSDILVSVIVPLRNEEKNVKNLLEHLLNQSYSNYEIICVDDSSEDNTYDMTSKYPVELIKAPKKPEGWIGKSWALLHGTKKANGDLYLFVDADVSLSSNIISDLVSEYIKENKVISIMPYHKTKLFYEQFSFFFNYLQYAANGMGFKNDKYYLGLYGPIILMPKKIYQSIGTHEVVNNSVIEDIDLGIKLHREGYNFSLFMGREDASYRMYPDGFNKLVQGWSKNQASVFIQIRLMIVLLVAIIIGMYIKIPIILIKALILKNINEIVIYSIFYWVLVIILSISSKHIGKYKWYVYILYPIYLAFYLYIFLWSIIKRKLKIPMLWKGRKINTNVK